MKTHSSSLYGSCFSPAHCRMYPDYCTAGPACCHHGDTDTRKKCRNHRTCCTHCDDQRTGQNNTIIIQNMAYNPAQITVNAGDIVRWVNKDTVVHSVVFSKASMIDPSGGSASGQSFSVRFYNTGVYNYSCGQHPQMQGSVVVT